MSRNALCNLKSSSPGFVEGAKGLRSTTGAGIAS